MDVPNLIHFICNKITNGGMDEALINDFNGHKLRKRNRQTGLRRQETHFRELCSNKFTTKIPKFPWCAYIF